MSSGAAANELPSGEERMRAYAEAAPLLYEMVADTEASVQRTVSIDAISLEIGQVFQLCSQPEPPGASERERELRVGLLHVIWEIDEQLRRSDCPEVGAKLVLFRRVLLTSPNLTALCRMADPHVKTGGYIRCYAVSFLCKLRSIESVWDVRLQDGKSFAMGLLKVMGMLLDPTIQAQHKPGCCCHDERWLAWGHASADSFVRDPPDQVVNVLNELNVQSILENPDCPVQPYDMLVFINIHDQAVALLKQDPESVAARQLLEQLGSCHVLFRRVLKRIVSGEVVCNPRSPNRMEELKVPFCFITRFLNCLVTVPNDDETDVLVQQALAYLQSAVNACMDEEQHLSDQDQDRYNWTYLVTEFYMKEQAWRELKQENTQERWIRFRKHILATTVADFSSDLSRSMKRFGKKMLKESINLDQGEMCANCSILEATLGKKLGKCARCKQIKYCSTKCQAKHWKVHKKQCKQTSTT